jgi:hypothetical protein
VAEFPFQQVAAAPIDSRLASSSSITRYVLMGSASSALVSPVTDIMEIRLRGHVQSDSWLVVRACGTQFRSESGTIPRCSPTRSHAAWSLSGSGPAPARARSGSLAHAARRSTSAVPP